MTQPSLIPDEAHRWRLSAAWASRQHDCTLAGITGLCGAACCTAGPTGLRWPPRAYGPGNAVCGNLGPEGCRLGDDRPVMCLLYPLKVNPSGTIVLHHRTVAATSCCAGNHGRGPMLVDAMQGSLVVLFGEAEYARIRAEVHAGRDPVVEVPPEVWAAHEHEATLEAEDAPARGRSTYPEA